MDHIHLPFQLLTESILSPAFFNVDEKIQESKWIGISLNGNPFLIIAENQGISSDQLVDRLLKCPDFVLAVEYQVGPAILSKIEFNSADIPKMRLVGLKKSEQGVLDTVADVEAFEGPLLAVFLSSPESISSLALHCCIQTDIMQCFEPESKALSHRIELQEIHKNNYS